MSTKDIRILQKSDSYVNWIENDPLIMPGEICFETETKKIKLGTGDINDSTTWKHWSELNYNENGRGFKILAITGNGYTLSSTTGISVGDTVTIRISHEWDHYSTIKSISEDVITLKDTIPDDPLETDEDNPENGVIENYLIIEGKPYLGDMQIGYFAHVEGENCIAQNRSAHAEGRQTQAVGQYAHAEGRGTLAGYAAHAEGKNTKALGDNSHAEGGSSTAFDPHGHAEGEWTYAYGYGAHTEGYGVYTYGRNAHAEGYITHGGVKGFFGTLGGTKGNVFYSNSSISGVTIGQTACFVISEPDEYGQQAFASCNITAVDTSTKTITLNKAPGLTFTDSKLSAQDIEQFMFIKENPALGTLYTGFNAHAEGKQTIAAGPAAHAEGHGTVAGGRASHTEGFKTQALHNFAHAEGLASFSQGIAAHAEGYGTAARANYSHTEGYYTDGSGLTSHAEGYSTYALEDYTHSENRFTIASGTCAHAEGNGTIAYGKNSHAEGVDTIANGEASHTQGIGTKATETAQFALGKYNVTDSKAIIVGNGTSNSNRSNIHTLDWDGNAWFAGDITIGENKAKVLTNSAIEFDFTYETIYASTSQEDISFGWVSFNETLEPYANSNQYDIIISFPMYNNNTMNSETYIKQYKAFLKAMPVGGSDYNTNTLFFIGDTSDLIQFETITLHAKVVEK